MEKLKVWAEEPNSEGITTPSLEEVFPKDFKEIKIEFNKFIESLRLEGETCIDAYRISLAQDKECMKFYNTFVTCCGSRDIGKEVNGVLYMFGCNFGH